MEEAEELYQEALKLDPHNALALAGMGYVRASQGRWKQAHQFLIKALKENPYLRHARNNLAAVYCKLNTHLDTALELVNQAIQSYHRQIQQMSSHPQKKQLAQLISSYQLDLLNCYDTKASIMAQKGWLWSAVSAWHKGIENSTTSIVAVWKSFNKNNSMLTTRLVKKLKPEEKALLASCLVHLSQTLQQAGRPKRAHRIRELSKLVEERGNEHPK
jgi:tetratricopeptide (TPR) repeat protein